MNRVEVHGFLISSRQLGDSDISEKIYDTFIGTDPSVKQRICILSTDVHKWRYSTFTIAEEKDARKTTKERRTGFSIFEMDKDAADFAGALYENERTTQ